MKEGEQQESPKVKARFDHICEALFASAAEGLLVVDRKGLIKLLNRRAEEMFGYTRGEMQDQPVELLVPESFRGAHIKNKHDYLANPSRRSMGTGLDLWAQRKDGSTFPVEISLNHFESEGDEYAMALISDITRRKEVEQQLERLNEELEGRVQERTRELRESQHLYGVIARNFPNGSINVFDREFNYVFAEGRELFRMGVTSDQLVGTNYLARLSPVVRETVKSKLLTVFEGQSLSFDLDLDEKTFEIHAVPLRDAEGLISRILVVETNTTQQKRAAADIIKALEKERQLNEMKSRFVSMASHEFRTPLSTILTSISLLGRYTAPEHEEQRAKHFTRIRSSVHNLTAILNDFLSLDKLESGMLAPNPEEFDLHTMLDDLIDEMQSVCKVGQVIKLFYAGENLVTVDRNMVRNIILNLLSNASKYSDEGKVLEIKANVADGKIRIDVRDEGIGIPEGDAKHMFERFFRAHNATNIQGTGLGLNIVKKYIDLMNGDIWFESKPGKGSVFSFVLPQKLMS
jgi:PAS domain S-box-containing protein